MQFARQMSPTHKRFFAAWAIGLPTIFLVDVADGFGALFAVSGVLLVWAGWALARDGTEWDRFREAASRQGFASKIPDRPFVRWGFVLGYIAIGAVWLVGGVLGVAALLGRYEYPT